MASTLKINNLDTASGTTITVPTGKQLIATDTGGLKAPGTIVQITNGVLKTRAQTASTSSTSTGLTASITPKFSTSKVLVQVTGGWGIDEHNLCKFQLYRGGSNIISGTSGNNWGIFQHQITGGSNGSTASQGFHTAMVLSYMDSPSSTSSLTYQLNFYGDNAGATSSFNGRPQASEPGYAQMILTEIAQ